MQREKIIRSINSARLLVSQALVALLLVASVASAQTDAGRAQQDKPFYNVKSAAPKAPDSVSQKYEKEGILVEFSMKAIEGGDAKGLGLAAGADAMVSFRLTDKRTGQPVTGLHPNAWLNSRTAEHTPNEAECKDKIRTFVSGSRMASPVTV